MISDEFREMKKNVSDSFSFVEMGILFKLTDYKISSMCGQMDVAKVFSYHTSRLVIFVENCTNYFNIIISVLFRPVIIVFCTEKFILEKKSDWTW